MYADPAYLGISVLVQKQAKRHNPNPSTPMLYAILETSEVPYGNEPTVVAYVRSLNIANPIVDDLFGRYPSRYFEVIEEDEIEVEGLPYANVYTVDAPYTFQAV